MLQYWRSIQIGTGQNDLSKHKSMKQSLKMKKTACLKD